MFTVYNITPLIEDVLKIKGVNYSVFERMPPDTPTYYKGPIIEGRDIRLMHEEIIIRFLDECYPTPQLIAGDCKERASIHVFIEHIKHLPQNAISSLINQADPFISGKAITLIDMILYRTSSDQAYKKFIQKAIYNNG